MKKILSITLLLILVIYIAGCTTTTETKQEDDSDLQTKTTTKTAPTHSKYVPASIVEFASADEGELIRFYFQVQDDLGRKIPPDGNVEFKISDNSDNILYQKSFSVSPSDYVDYKIILTGQEMGKAYEWRIPISEIKKGTSSYGKAEMTFESGGKKLSATNEFVTIPSLSEEEIAEIYEEEYDKSKIVAEKTFSNNNFKIDVNSFGFYKVDSYSGIEEYFRIDFNVKNIGSGSEYFSPSGMAIIDAQGNQYDAAYGGTLDTFKKMFPDTKQKGYVLFEEVPKTITSAKLIFELGHDNNWNPIVMEYQLPVSS